MSKTRVYKAGLKMDPDIIRIQKRRLAEREQCERDHPVSERVPHNGFGWTGTMCPKCGFMFFGEWEPWAKDKI